MLKALRALPDSPFMIDDMTVAIKRHPMARRLTLRFDSKKNHFVMSAPKRASKKSMLEFAQTNASWMRKQIVVAPPSVVLKPGDFLPLEGKDRLIVHQDAPGVKIELSEDTITVFCREARFARALERFLRQRALEIVTRLSYEKAALIGKPIQSVTCRDTTSRWGSCTHDGKLSYSWRVIMAPFEVIDYLVAHEVAHLKVFNHSARFWETCRKLTDHTTFGKHWLQQNGSKLHQITIIARDNPTA